MSIDLANKNDSYTDEYGKQDNTSKYVYVFVRAEHHAEIATAAQARYRYINPLISLHSIVRLKLVAFCSFLIYFLFYRNIMLLNNVLSSLFDVRIRLA